MKAFPFDNASTKTISPRNLRLLQTFQKNLVDYEYLIENKDQSLFIVAKWKEGDNEQQKFLIVKNDGVDCYPLIYYKWKDYPVWDNYSSVHLTPDQYNYHWKGFKGFDPEVSEDKQLPAKSFTVPNNSLKGIYLRNTNDRGRGKLVRMALDMNDKVEVYLGDKNVKYYNETVQKKTLQDYIKKESLAITPLAKSLDMDFFMKNLVYPTWYFNEKAEGTEYWNLNYQENPMLIFFHAKEKENAKVNQ